MNRVRINNNLLNLWNKRDCFNQRRWGKDIKIEKQKRFPKGILSEVLLYSFYCILKSNLGFEDFALKYSLSLARRYQIAHRVKGKTFWGDEMFLIYPEFVSTSILRYGYFEEGLTTMVLEYLEPNMIFCDIGAHFGYYSLLASHIVGKRGHVHSFEPTPSTFSILRQNIKGKDNITINNCALLSEKRDISLVDHGPLYSGHNTITRSRCNPNVLKNLALQKITVQAIPFDQYMRNRDIRPDFIKIDVESAEYDVLLGMKETLNHFHPIISLEVGDKDLEGIKPSCELVLYLLKQGYDAYEYDGKNIVRHKLKKRYKSDNLLFLPKLNKNEESFSSNNTIFSKQIL